jgi:hypothetical protein
MRTSVVAIPTGEEMCPLKRFVSEGEACPLCSRSDDTVQHLPYSVVKLSTRLSHCLNQALLARGQISLAY